VRQRRAGLADGPDRLGQGDPAVAAIPAPGARYASTSNTQAVTPQTIVTWCTSCSPPRSTSL
jgi:hypothetical protein